MHQLTQHVHCSALPVGNRCTLCPKVNRNCPFSHFSLGCSEQMYERAATGIAAEWAGAILGAATLVGTAAAPTMTTSTRSHFLSTFATAPWPLRSKECTELF